MNSKGRLMISAFFHAIKSNRVLLVSRLPLRSSPNDIKDYFENYGPVMQVYRDIDMEFAHYTGPAFVHFEKQETLSTVLMQQAHVIDHKEVIVSQCQYLPTALRTYLYPTRKSEQRVQGIPGKEN